MILLEFFEFYRRTGLGGLVMESFFSIKQLYKQKSPLAEGIVISLIKATLTF